MKVDKSLKKTMFPCDWEELQGKNILGYLLIESGTQYEYRAFAKTLAEAKELFMQQWEKQAPPFSEWNTYDEIKDYFGIEIVPLYYGYCELT